MDDEDFLKPLLEILKNKKTMRINGVASHAGYLYHILGIFDDEQIAVKYFGKHHQRWHYEFFDIWMLYFVYQKGNLEIK